MMSGAGGASIPLRGAAAQERLQDEDRSELIDETLPAAAAHVGFVEHAIGFNRCKPLVEQMCGQLEPGAQRFSELFGFLGLNPRLTTHTQRQTDHNLTYVVSLDGAPE